MSGAASLEATAPAEPVSVALGASPGGLSVGANPARGETAITIAGRTLLLRPTFGALVKAEEELGSLIALIERTSVGGIKLGEIVALFWHCLTQTPGGLTREALGEAIVETGLAVATPVLKTLITQILKGI